MQGDAITIRLNMPELLVEGQRQEGDTLVVTVRYRCISRPCPRCGRVTSRVHHEKAQKPGVPMGGQGTGPGRRLKQYLDEQLPGRITNGDIAQIEGALLYSRDVREISFAGHVVSSLEDTEYGLSMVRQRKGEERGCSPSKATPTVSILRCRTR